jgi:hydroxyacylglutathione hydrolase
MFIRTVNSEGLAHLSHLVGSGGMAVVIDPRRDCSCYVELAAAAGSRASTGRSPSQ